MSISLSPEVQRRIERTLSDGRYSSASELMLDALDALEGADRASSERAQWFDAEVSEAIREIQRGEYTDYTQEELSRVFERARAQDLDHLTKTQATFNPIAGQGRFSLNVQ